MVYSGEGEGWGQCYYLFNYLFIFFFLLLDEIFGVDDVIAHPSFNKRPILCSSQCAKYSILFYCQRVYTQ